MKETGYFKLVPCPRRRRKAGSLPLPGRGDRSGSDRPLFKGISFRSGGFLHQRRPASWALPPPPCRACQRPAYGRWSPPAVYRRDCRWWYRRSCPQAHRSGSGRRRPGQAAGHLFGAVRVGRSFLLITVHQEGPLQNRSLPGDSFEVLTKRLQCFATALRHSEKNLIAKAARPQSLHVPGICPLKAADRNSLWTFRLLSFQKEPAVL